MSRLRIETLLRLERILLELASEQPFAQIVADEIETEAAKEIAESVIVIQPSKVGSTVTPEHVPVYLRSPKYLPSTLATWRNRTFLWQSRRFLYFLC